MPQKQEHGASGAHSGGRFGELSRKLGLLLLISLLATVLYFPNLTFRGYDPARLRGPT